MVWEHDLGWACSVGSDGVQRMGSYCQVASGHVASRGSVRDQYLGLRQFL